MLLVVDMHQATHLQKIVPELRRLLEPGVIGFINWFEVVEVSCSNGCEYLNVFSIYVAIEGTPPEGCKEIDFLNERNDRSVEGIKDHSFGVARRYVATEDLLRAAENFNEDGRWKAHTTPLSHGSLKASAPAFYAADGTHSIPLNRLLKNNFWNGSYVIELSDATKTGLDFLISNHNAIRALGVWVKKFVPIDIASVSDRLGNIIIQLPITSVAASFNGTKENCISLTVAWHPDVSHRPIHGTIELNFDGAIVAYGQKELSEGKNILVSDTTNRLFKGCVWDAEKNVILAAQAPTVFIGGVSGSSISIGGEHARVFFEKDSTGSVIRREISLLSQVRSGGVQRASSRPNGVWTERRISDSEIHKLVRSKYFVQYGGAIVSVAEHERALSDLRELVNKHGEHAVYLWDPYLSSSDVLAVLFHCIHVESELRALTSSKAYERHDQVDDHNRESILQKILNKLGCRGKRASAKNATKRENWIKQQAELLTDSIEGSPNINLEFRISFGPRGWPFHDRFLIFPRKDGVSPMVWSIGASVNHLGTNHAIIQQVAHPQPVLDAFEDLWARIDVKEHSVWNSPQ